MGPSPVDARTPKPVRIGVLGLDASHAISATRLLNEVASGSGAGLPAGNARVVAASPGPISHDFPPSHGRAAEIVATMRDELAIPIVDSAAEMAHDVDALIITAADPRAHPAVFAQVAAAGKPTAVVKVLSADAASAQQMVDLAGRSGVPLLAASPHRFGLPAPEGIADAGARARGADVVGRMPAELPIPAIFWYGAHLVDLLYAAMGPGCTTVTTTASGPDQDQVITGSWDDGRVGVIRGMAHWPRRWKVDLHADDGSTVSVDPTATGRPLLAGLLEQLIAMTHSGRSPVSAAELVEVVRFAEAAERSRLTGAAVAL